MKQCLFLWFLLPLIGCQQKPVQTLDKAVKTDQKLNELSAKIERIGGPALVVLGTAQDAGAPQLGCQKSCCRSRFLNPDPFMAVVSLGLVDPISDRNFLFEATPDIGKQLYWLQRLNLNSPAYPAGIFLTHAHIGHYSGLQFLGKESAAAHRIPIYVMPKMAEFLSHNGPWDALVNNQNIVLNQMVAGQPTAVSAALSVTPLLVPHRDEYSETVGYYIKGPEKSALFIPDIDKWNLWEESIEDWVKKVDYAFLDATFFSGDELGGRDMSQIPHPSVEESMELFENLTADDKKKVIFIHFNHTNALLDSNSEAFKEVQSMGFNVAQALQVFPL